MLTRQELIRTLQETGGSTPVLEFMTRDVPTVPENACLDNVYKQLQRGGTHRRRGRPSRACRLHHRRKTWPSW